MKFSDQLNAIMKSSGWSQEQLARELDVSFQTLNSWVNNRSQPRRKALLSIETLYFDIVGVDSVDETELNASKTKAMHLKFTPKSLTNDQVKLDKLTLYLTYHTNTIEGSTMTLSDVEDVIFDHKVLSNRTAIEQAEARNHQAAFIWVLDQLVQKGNSLILDEDFILGIHLRLLNGIMSDAGQYRKYSVRIMGSHEPLANWLKIPSLVGELVAELQQPSKDLVADLARSHSKFEQIHPFSDGNGRTGRLLLLAQALRVNVIPPLVIKEQKHAYFKYLETAQTIEDYKPLELFIAQSMQFCFDLLS